MNKNSNPALDRLALGSDCRRCGAYADQECKTPGGKATAPHQARVDRACAQFQVSAKVSA